jgi:aromatic-L-amino-acid decarboxylase
MSDEMTPEEVREAARRTTEWVADYRERLEDLPVLPRVEPGDVAAALPEGPPREGEPFETILDDLDEVIVPGLTHWNHPRFFAYFPSSSSPPAVLAEYVAAALNQNAMKWRTSPAGTELEERMADWVRQLVGLPGTFRGVLQDTASSGSFTSLVAAREALGVEIRGRGMAGRADLPALTLYVSEQAHSSLEKAAIAAGLGHTGVRKVRADDDFRMDPDALADGIAEDRAAGRLPVMVCATIGTTSTASVDPVDRIAEVCREQDVWLHVDAAYAGPAAMLPELRDRFAGWERADSVVLNPHKWLSTPIDCSVLLFRDPEPFRASLALTPEYLRSDEQDSTDLMDFGLPLGRRFRALKLWFLLRWHGADGLRGRLRDHIEWARGFADRVEDDPRFELVAPPSFSTVVFRALPAPGEGTGGDADEEGRESARPLERGEGVDTLAANELNRDLLDRVNREGDVFLSHTELAGSYVLRLSVGAVATRERHVREAWDALAGAYEALEGGG